jgi:NTE family protein
VVKKVDINLALQGGGAHGAFTWGVLDRLLEDDKLTFRWISAASAGAVNAVALAAGLAEGSRDKAREKLFKIWQAVHKSGVPDLTRLNPFLNGMAAPKSLTHMASMWSPYEFNPLGFDPLRRLITDHVDFELLRAKSPVELLIAATHVATGQARLFRRHEVTVETVLASACLPTLHHAVEIDGESYWDGGFSANPDLVTLGAESPVGDTLLVMVSPRTNTELPTTVRDISIHANRLTFNAPLLRDIDVITAVRETAGTLLAKGRLAPLTKHRFHLIDGGPVTGSLDPQTSVQPDWAMMTYLHGAGRDHAEKWLEASRGSIGRHETVDLSRHFFPVMDGNVRQPPVATGRRAAAKRAGAEAAVKRPL